MKHFKNVTLNSVFKDLQTNYVYAISLSYKEDESLPFSTDCIIKIQGSFVPEKFINVLTGKTKKEYLAYGMCNVDVDTSSDGLIRITESPFDGVRDSYELDKESCDRLLQIFEKELSNLTSAI